MATETTAPVATPDATTAAITDAAPVAQAEGATAAAPAAAATPAPTAQQAVKDGEAKPAEAAPAEKPEADEIAASLAELNREIRAAKAERERAKGELAKVADRVAVADHMDKVKAAIKARDFVTALKSIDPDLSVDEAILTLLEQAKATDAQPLTQADIERITAAKIEEQKKADAERVRLEQEQAIKAQAEKLESATKTYLVACGKEQETGAFPLVNAHSTSEEQVEALEKMIRRHATEEYARSKEVPSPKATLEWLERKLEADMKAAGYTKAEIDEAKGDPAKPLQTAPVPDTKGGTREPTKQEKRESMAEYDKRIKAQLRALKANGAAATR